MITTIRRLMAVRTGRSVAVALVGLVLLTGCASTGSGRTDDVRRQTDGQDVPLPMPGAGIQCEQSPNQFPRQPFASLVPVMDQDAARPRPQDAPAGGAGAGTLELALLF